VYYIHFKYIILYKQLDVNAEVSRVFIGVGHYILWKILFDIIGRRRVVHPNHVILYYIYVRLHENVLSKTTNKKGNGEI